MKILRKQSVAVLVLISLFTLVSGLCYGTFASASTSAQYAAMPAMDMSHCGNQTVSFEKGSPLNNAVMPCCVDRHDGQATTLPTILKDKVKFSADLIEVQPLQTSLDFAVQCNSFAHAPPGQPDILSSVVKIE
ncbi:MAG TPA: hypothetical protein VF817_02545 [Patescibacteria group bacterium]